MYRDTEGNEYFVVDSHLHWWDGSPENQKNKYGAGFISCFYDYHSGLSPAEYVWPREKYEKYDQETMVNDLFVDGYVDIGILQSTYLSDFYVNGFNDRAQRDGEGQVPRPLHPQQRLGPPRRGGGARRLRGEGGEVQAEGQALHRGMAR